MPTAEPLRLTPDELAAIAAQLELLWEALVRDDAVPQDGRSAVKLGQKLLAHAAAQGTRIVELERLVETNRWMRSR